MAAISRAANAPSSVSIISISTTLSLIVLRYPPGTVPHISGSKAWPPPWLRLPSGGNIAQSFAAFPSATERTVGTTRIRAPGSIPSCIWHRAISFLAVGNEYRATGHLLALHHLEHHRIPDLGIRWCIECRPLLPFGRIEHSLFDGAWRLFGDVAG